MRTIFWLTVVVAAFFAGVAAERCADKANFKPNFWIEPRSGKGIYSPGTLPGNSAPNGR